MVKNMVLSTTQEIANAKIVKTLGIVRGSTVRARNFVSDMFAGIKMTIGGEISQYTKLLADAREQALQRMIEDAQRLGANAVIGLRFGTSQVMQGTAEILAYGTAVIIEDLKNNTNNA